ncbi:MAG: phosphatase PAP2 family protein, partial [Myxococcota bacterium]
MNRIAFCIVCSALWSSPGWAQQTRPEIEIDLVADTALLSAALGFGLLLETIISTGELRPQAPVDASELAAIDRWRATSDSVFDRELSNVGLGIMSAWVIADIALIETLGRGDEWTDYFMVYAQSAAFTLALTDLAKIAVRRPRPIAYRQARNGDDVAEDTNTALSFFSGHAAMTGALAGTASYLAWLRGDQEEAWIVTLGSLFLTGFVSTMRVVEGKHFPTNAHADDRAGNDVGRKVFAL